MPDFLTFDSRGRVTIPAGLRKGLGEHLMAIRTPRGILLRSVPSHVDIPAPAEGISGEDAARAEVDAEYGEREPR
jgi:bifunctional DNA-binding transcriptional regulator/antitoxin component of YhaV-PrlF toxin-antitoxin module